MVGPFDLSGKVAVVTGGARGIGAAITAALGEAGASVAVWDLGTPAPWAAPAVACTVDVCDRSSVEAGLAEVERQLGPVDVLVNDAGIDRIGPFLESDEGDWRRILAVNLEGTIRCCHVVCPGMLERGRGAVVSVASDAGRVGSTGEAVYSGSKGGVIAFTKALAREVASGGVRANCVSPGPTNTSLLDQLAEVSQKLYDSLARAIPMRRVAEPADIAPAVVFLASDGARYITGQTLSVSGGLTMS